MRNFAVAALAVVPAFAQWQWTDFPIEVDGTPQVKYFSSRQTSAATVNGNQMDVASNNAIFLKNSMGDDLISDMFKPYLRGGSISYEVDLSKNDCGCVAGVYLVKTSAECGQSPQEGGAPQCPTIDIMQANPYGFNVQAHPCNGGSCDAISQCDLNMKMDGVEKYGEGAYGPGGSLIDSS